MHPRETDPLLQWTATPSPRRKATFLWLLPVLALSGLERGISMSNYVEHSQHTVCRGKPYPCGSSFRAFFELPGFGAYVDYHDVYTAVVASFLTIGYWSVAADRRGRKVTILASTLGLVLIDVVYHLVAHVQMAPATAAVVLRTGLVLQNLIGAGVPGYIGASRAYIFDVAESPLQRITLSALNDVATFGMLFFGAVVGHFVGYRNAYLLGTIIGIGNCAWIYYLLPESLSASAPITEADTDVAPKSALRTLFTPINVLFQGHAVGVTALAFFIWCFAAAADVAVIRYTLAQAASVVTGPLPLWAEWIGYTIPRVIGMGSLVIVIPLIVRRFQHKHVLIGNTHTRAESEDLALRVALPLTQHGLLLCAVACAGVVGFTMRLSALYVLLVALLPLATTALPPLLYALAATYHLKARRSPGEMAQLMSALALGVFLFNGISFEWYGAGISAFGATAAWAVVALAWLKVAL
ncbi:hypothetical protein HMN09_01185700 [Mycena chlorophos]|uniref:MFS general substrate transporter n=1 Tax=Mycena chlorophos TaxID=658473 RepID=A0A8H6VVY6_MYCCL|nr:hypothetical protein HMN09_01185700 [Mycena chlorophos]